MSRNVFNRKDTAFKNKKNITIVGVSNWLNQNSKSSSLLKEKDHINLPNPIKTNIFKLFDKLKARELWDLPQDKKLVLFEAMRAASDPRKGFKELSEAMNKLEVVMILNLWSLEVVNLKILKDWGLKYIIVL